MSRQWIVFWVAAVAATVVVTCIWLLHTVHARKRAGVVPEGIWHLLDRAQSRPHAAERLATNLVFWIVLMGVLWGFSTCFPRLGPLAVESSTPLGITKMVDYADGELWLLQVLAGMLVFIGYKLIQRVVRWRNGNVVWLEDSRRYIIDDFWSAFLNFGSLFIISGFVQAFEGRFHFLITMLLGFFNVVVYAFWSNLATETAPACACSQHLPTCGRVSNETVRQERETQPAPCTHAEPNTNAAI
jgi:hypothetical protein